MISLRALAVSSCAAALLAACGGAAELDLSPAPAHFDGQLRSEGEVVALDDGDYLTSWHASYQDDRDGQEQQEIYLSTRTRPFSGGGRDRWALTIRIPRDQTSGTRGVQELGLHLFSNYKNDCCLNRDDLFGASESYDKVYAAVRGTVKFESDLQGSFDVEMQEESAVRSGQFSGPTFRLRGCWKIGNEVTPAGCMLKRDGVIWPAR